MGSDDANHAAMAAIIRQEQALVLPAFDEAIAYEIGAALRERCAVRKAAVVIDIRSSDRRYFFCAMPGATPDNDEWARRKGNVALRFHASSFRIGLRLRMEGRSAWPDAALAIEDYADHGGAFPVRVRGAGVVAAITVSGLPSREDHDLIVETLAARLGLNDVAPTP